MTLDEQIHQAKEEYLNCDTPCWRQLYDRYQSLLRIKEKRDLQVRAQRAVAWDLLKSIFSGIMIALAVGIVLPLPLPICIATGGATAILVFLCYMETWGRE